MLEIWQRGGPGWRLIMGNLSEVQAIELLLLEALGFQTVLSPCTGSNPGAAAWASRPIPVPSGSIFGSRFWGWMTIACLFAAAPSSTASCSIDGRTRGNGESDDVLGPLPRDAWAVESRDSVARFSAGIPERG